jgi:hypothetical protein
VSELIDLSRALPNPATRCSFRAPTIHCGRRPSR